MSMWQWDVHTVFSMLRPRPNALITDNSVLVRHGSLTFYSHNTGTNKPRYFFLFDHAFLVTKQRKRSKFQLKIYITLRPGLKLITDERDNQFRLNATLKGKSYPIIMWAYSRKEKDAWVRDIMNAIGRLGDRSYGLEANPVTAQNRETYFEEEKAIPGLDHHHHEEDSSPRIEPYKSRRGSVPDSPHSYLRDDEDSPEFRRAPRSPRSDVVSVSRSSRTRGDDSSSSDRSRNDSPSGGRRRSISAKGPSSSGGGGSRRGSTTTTASSSRTERAVAREQDLPAENRPKRSKKVWYDSDEEPHWYTDSDPDSEGDEDEGSGDDSGSNSSNSSYESDRRSNDSGSYRSSRRSHDSANNLSSRRASEPDADHSRSASKKEAKSLPRRASAVSDGVLAPPPKASSSRKQRMSTSSSTGNLPALDRGTDPRKREERREKKKEDSISDAFDLLSLSHIPPTATGGPTSQSLHSAQSSQISVASYPHQPHPHGQPHHAHSHEQPHHPHSHHAGGGGGGGGHNPTAMGVKVMDVKNLNAQDFNKLTSKGFGASQPSSTHSSAPTHTTPSHTTTPTSLSGLQQGQPKQTELLSLSATFPASTPTTTTTTTPTTTTPDPQLYQQMLLQQQQQYLQLLQQQQRLSGQLTATPSLSTSQPLQTSLGQPAASPLLGQPSSAYASQLSQLQMQQLQLQQLQQQAQLQQQLAKQQQQQSTLGGHTGLGGLSSSTTATPLAYSTTTTTTTPQTGGVVYVDPLTYMQYQQQLLQYQQQQQQALQQQQQQQVLQQQQQLQQLQKQYSAPGGLSGYGYPTSGGSALGK